MRFALIGWVSAVTAVRCARVGFLMSLAAVSLALAALSGCGGHQPAPVSPEEQARADRAERIGALIFEQDAAAARATDALVAAAGPKPPVHGWVTRVSSDAATTSFLGADDTQVVYEVVAAAGAAPSVTKVDPPHPLDTEGAAIFRAQTTARHALQARCGDSYNPVVLPAALLGKDGWLVYLLAASTRPDVRVLAGHHLVRVSADGNAVLEDVPLSGSCIVARGRPQSRDLLLLSRTTGDMPTEADYYTALEYRTRMAVVFPDGHVWVVSPRAHPESLATSAPPNAH
jgi:hypothetical protein